MIDLTSRSYFLDGKTTWIFFSDLSTRDLVWPIFEDKIKTLETGTKYYRSIVERVSTVWVVMVKWMCYPSRINYFTIIVCLPRTENVPEQIKSHWKSLVKYYLKLYYVIHIIIRIMYMCNILLL